MESFNDFYDIESPRTSERKMTTIENSIQQSLLYNNEMSKSYNIYGYFLKILLWIIALGIVSILIIVILLLTKRLS